MTDNNKIIKLLEAMSEDVVCSVTDKDGKTFFVYFKDILALINRQKAEVERLNKEVDRLSQIVLYHDGHIADARAEAIKEFAERLKNECWDADTHVGIRAVVDKEDIDNLVKEMVGDTE